MTRDDPRPILAYVVIAYAISWAIWFAGILSIDGMTGIGDERFSPFLLAGSFGPSIAALVVAGVTGGRAAIFGLLRRLILVRVNWRVYAVTFFLMPTIGLVFYIVGGIAPRISIWKIAATMIPLLPINALLGGSCSASARWAKNWAGAVSSNLACRAARTPWPPPWSSA